MWVLQILLFPNALCCSLYERKVCICVVTKIFTKFLPANYFCQLLRVTRKHSCTSAGNAQAQLHFRDDQQSRGLLELATSPIDNAFKHIIGYYSDLCPNFATEGIGKHQKCLSLFYRFQSCPDNAKNRSDPIVTGSSL